MESEQVAGIVKSLTKAQREAVINAYSPWGDVWKAGGSWRTTNILFEHGLTDHDELLTPLGLAVRSALAKENDRAE